MTVTGATGGLPRARHARSIRWWCSVAHAARQLAWCRRRCWYYAGQRADIARVQHLRAVADNAPSSVHDAPPALLPSPSSLPGHWNTSTRPVAACGRCVRLPAHEGIPHTRFGVDEVAPISVVYESDFGGFAVYSLGEEAGQDHRVACSARTSSSIHVSGRG